MVESLLILAATLLADGDLAFQAREYEKAGQLYEKAFAAADKQPDIAAEAAAQVARSYLIRGKKEEGRPWLAKAKALAKPQRIDRAGWQTCAQARGERGEKPAVACRVGSASNRAAATLGWLSNLGRSDRTLD